MSTLLNTTKFKRLIKEKFGTQSAFADACGVSRQYISEVIAGRTIPTLERMVQMADLLDVSVDELLGKELTLAGVLG